MQHPEDLADALLLEHTVHQGRGDLTGAVEEAGLDLDQLLRAEGLVGGVEAGGRAARAGRRAPPARAAGARTRASEPAGRAQPPSSLALRDVRAVTPSQAR